MAELVVTQDELALRRRARRRLVGAVAIALTCVVALPMLFDSEPKPLGPEVDIRIPAQDTPFEAAPVVTPPVQPVPEAKPAEPTQPHAPEVANVPATLPAKAATTLESGKSKPGVGARPRPRQAPRRKTTKPSWAISRRLPQRHRLKTKN